MENPIPDLLNDDVFNLLLSKGIIDEKSVRDYIIRKRFRSMREEKIAAGDAIDKLRQLYPYLQYDTIRKIVYNPKRTDSN